MRRQVRPAFSLAEVMMSVGVLAIILITLVASTMSTLRVNEKANLLGPAIQVAEGLMDRTLYEVSYDIPAGTRASFWAAAGQWRPTPPGPPAMVKQTIGGVDYEYIIYANTVADAAGGDLGAGGPAALANNRVKKVDLLLTWWNTAPGQSRQGYGRLQVGATRLINEASYGP